VPRPDAYFWWRGITRPNDQGESLGKSDKYILYILLIEMRTGSQKFVLLIFFFFVLFTSQKFSREWERRRIREQQKVRKERGIENEMSCAMVAASCHMPHVANWVEILILWLQ